MAKGLNWSKTEVPKNFENSMAKGLIGGQRPDFSEKL
jgi:hypothetical protein